MPDDNHCYLPHLSVVLVLWLISVCPMPKQWLFSQLQKDFAPPKPHILI